MSDDALTPQEKLAYARHLTRTAKAVLGELRDREEPYSPTWSQLLRASDNLLRALDAMSSIGGRDRLPLAGDTREVSFCDRCDQMIKAPLGVGVCTKCLP